MAPPLASKPEHPNQHYYRIGDIEIDPTQRCIRTSAGVLYPRQKVFDVFLHLLRNRHRVVYKDELVLAIWNGASVSEDVLVGCVGEIRKILGDESRSPRFVKTFPKAGYRFVGPAEEVSASSRAPANVRPRRWAWPVVAASLTVLLAAVYWQLQVRQSGVRTPTFEVGWWKFDEGQGNETRDASGNGNSGVLMQGPKWAPGRNGSALEFDGIASYLQGRAPGNGFPRGSAPRTVTAWIRTNSGNGVDTNLFHYGMVGLTPPRANFHLFLSDLGTAGVGNGYGYGVVRGTIRLNDGCWHHVAGIYEGSDTNVARVLADGAEDVARLLSKPPDTGNGTPWSIGLFMGGGTPFRGVIDDVRIYARALRIAEVQALYRCTPGEADLVLPDGKWSFIPIFASGVSIEKRDEPAATVLRPNGPDEGGFQFAAPSSDCGLSSLRGANVGQDLRLRVDLLVPPGYDGHASQAGPYLRARSVFAGESILGPDSGGYWVKLYSTGVVKVQRLNYAGANQGSFYHAAVLAASAQPAEFDSHVFHTLEIEARQRSMCTWLDGKLLEFEQGGVPTTKVSLPPAGVNDGAAGIAFSVEATKGRIGPQQARNVVLRRFPPL